MTQMLGLAIKDFKMAIINILKYLEEEMPKMIKHMGNCQHGNTNYEIKPNINYRDKNRKFCNMSTTFQRTLRKNIITKFEDSSIEFIITNMETKELKRSEDLLVTYETISSLGCVYMFRVIKHNGEAREKRGSEEV